jgi:hypothetical protein
VASRYACIHKCLRANGSSKNSFGDPRHDLGSKAAAENAPYRSAVKRCATQSHAGDLLFSATC